jgi:fructose-specific PTS system IIA-like component
VVRSDSQSREEAIRELVGALYITNRTEDADGLEQAVWERELASSTGLGHGFAIPHCRSDAVESNSIALLKLSDPIHWGSVDDKPVQTVILLALRSTDAADSHIKVFAKLARKLMNHKFRDALNALQDAHSICSFLAGELEVSLPEQNSQSDKQSQTIDSPEKH